MSERAIQNQIRNALADGRAFMFRANVGRAWTGDARQLGAGRVMISNARPFSSGLPAGFSDLFGWVPVTITSDMIGDTVAVFAAVEVKTPNGRVAPNQAAFLNAVQRSGGRAGVARSTADAISIVHPTIDHPTPHEEPPMKPTDLISACEALGWTVADTARELGVSERTVSNWRTGSTPVPTAVARLLPYLIDQRADDGAGER